jgi:hypothetical protein
MERRKDFIKGVQIVKKKLKKILIFAQIYVQITETREFEISWKALKYNLILKLIKCPKN